MLLQVLVFLVKGPAAFVVKAFQSVQLAGSTVWQGAKPLGKLARSASGLVHTTSLAATSSGASVADMGHQVSAFIANDIDARADDSILSPLQAERFTKSLTYGCHCSFLWLTAAYIMLDLSEGCRRLWAVAMPVKCTLPVAS